MAKKEHVKIKHVKINDNTTIFSPLWNIWHYIHMHIMYLDNSKFFVGIIMILLNIGSKFITIQFSKSTEEYLKATVSKSILIFCMAYMGTRNLITALILTAVFTILSDHLFNEESSLCIVPHDYRVLHKLNKVLDENNNNNISETEIASAIAVLEKARREKQRKAQKDAFDKFEHQKL
jgi:hypothetical protein